MFQSNEIPTSKVRDKANAVMVGALRAPIERVTGGSKVVEPESGNV